MVVREANRPSRRRTNVQGVPLLCAQPHERMKKTVLLVTGIAAALAGCRKEEVASDDPTPAPTYTTASYAPYAVGNWWVFTGVNVPPGGTETPNSLRDSLYVAGDSTIDGRSYAHLRGMRFGSLVVDQWVGVDGPRLVQPNGAVLMDVTAVSDTIEVSPGSTAIDSIATVLKSQSLALVTPAGTYVSDHAREHVFYMAAGFTSPLFEREHYVAGIGIAEYTSFYASSAVEVRMRLAAYHIEP